MSEVSVSAAGAGVLEGGVVIEHSRELRLRGSVDEFFEEIGSATTGVQAYPVVGPGDVVGGVA